MKIVRKWSMPNKNTFLIKPVKSLLRYYIKQDDVWLDPFSNDNTIKKLHYNNVITNDLNVEYKTDYNLEALEFIKKFNGVDGVLFDPPYSIRQISECYKGIGLSVTGETTRSSTYSRWKDSISEVIKPGGICISFSWNSTGLGEKRGFHKIFILLICHGGAHNDTIVVIERKEKYKTLKKVNGS